VNAITPGRERARATARPVEAQLDGSPAVIADLIARTDETTTFGRSRDPVSSPARLS
jgi:hypothetical protein